MSNENGVNTQTIKGRNNTSFASANPKQTDNTPYTSQLTTNENSRMSNNYFSFLKIKNSPNFNVQTCMITYNNLNKYNSTLDKCYTKVMTNLIQKVPSRAFSIIKDLELDRDDVDHINTYYSLDKSLQLLRKILDYYEIFSLRLPTFQYMPSSNPIQEYHFWRKKHLEDLEFGNTHDEASKVYFRSVSNSFIETDNGKGNTRQASEFNLDIPDDSFLNSRQKCSFTTLFKRESGYYGSNYKANTMNSSVTSFKLGAKHIAKHSIMQPRDFNLVDSASISIIMNSNMKTVGSKTIKNDEDVSMISSQILFHLNSKRTSLARMPEQFVMSNQERKGSSNTLASPKTDHKISPNSKEKQIIRKKSLQEAKPKDTINFTNKSKGHHNAGYKSDTRQALKTPISQAANQLITKDKNQVKEINMVSKTTYANNARNSITNSTNPQANIQPNEGKVKSKNASKTGQVIIKESKTSAAPTPTNQISKKIDIIVPPKKEKSVKNIHKQSANANPVASTNLPTSNPAVGNITSKAKLPQSCNLVSAALINEPKKTLTKQKSQAGLSKKTSMAKSGQRSKSNSLEKKPKKHVGSFHEAAKIESQQVASPSTSNNNLQTKPKIIVNLCKEHSSKQNISSAKLSQSRPISKNKISTSGKISKEKTAADKLSHTKSTACIAKPKLLKTERQTLDITKKMDDSLERIIDEELEDGQQYPSGRKTEITRNLITTFDSMTATKTGNLFKPYDTENDRTETGCPFSSSNKKDKENKHKICQTITSISNLKTAKIIDKSNSCKKNKELKEGLILPSQGLNSTTTLNSTNALISKPKKSA